MTLCALAKHSMLELRLQLYHPRAVSKSLTSSVMAKLKPSVSIGRRSGGNQTQCRWQGTERHFVCRQEAERHEQLDAGGEWCGREQAAQQAPKKEGSEEEESMSIRLEGNHQGLDQIRLIPEGEQAPAEEGGQESEAGEWDC